MPEDSEALEQELRVLEYVGGERNVIGLIAVVISRNPYHSRSTINTLHHYFTGKSPRTIPNRTSDTVIQLSRAA